MAQSKLYVLLKLSGNSILILKDTCINELSGNSILILKDTCIYELSGNSMLILKDTCIYELSGNSILILKDSIYNRVCVNVHVCVYLWVCIILSTLWHCLVHCYKIEALLKLYIKTCTFSKAFSKFIINMPRYISIEHELSWHILKTFGSINNDLPCTKSSMF